MGYRLLIVLETGPADTKQLDDAGRYYCINECFPRSDTSQIVLEALVIVTPYILPRH
jgi:hypothetical protein